MDKHYNHNTFFSWFIHNPVASTLLMIFLVSSGLYLIRNITVESFPEIDPRTIAISIPYPGSTPEAVEASINQRAEEAIAGIEGIKKISSTAKEGIGVVNVTLEDFADKQEILNTIQTAIDQIADFPPEDAEDPSISIVSDPQNVIVVALYGEVPERTLREFTYDVRDGLTRIDGISLAHVLGVRDYEITIELDEYSLQKYKLSFSEVADAVREFSINIPGGKIQSQAGEILLRTDQQAYRQHDFEAIVLRTDPTGAQLTLADVATINDGFESIDSYSVFNGKPAAFISLERADDEQILEIEEAVNQYIDQLALPKGIEVTTWFNTANDLRSRIDLLIENGLMGLVLVFAILALFLHLKLAFWTTMGIPIAFLGAFFIIYLGGGTINMISLFAFILVLGIVVDDSIIIGESIFAKREQGLGPVEAAMAGLSEMVSPVTIGVLTTIIAFIPLMFTTGFLGQVLSVVPLVVVSVLLMSLIEAYLILPSHLSKVNFGQQSNSFTALQEKLRQGLQHIVDTFYLPSLHWALKFPYVILAIALALLMMIAGAIKGGHIKTVFFPVISGNEIIVTVRLPNGSPATETALLVKQVLSSVETVRAEFDQQFSHDEYPSIIRNISASVGSTPLVKLLEGKAGSDNTGGRSHRGEVVIELVPNEERSFSTTEIENRWRELVKPPPGANVFFYSNLLSSGSDISVELSHSNNQTLLLAVDRLKKILGEYDGVTEINDTFSIGKDELQLSLTNAGLAAGLTLNDLARQVRQAFFGEEAQRIQRGRDDIKVLVRYSEQERRSLDSIYNMRIRLDSGEELPFHVVADVEQTQAYSFIQRTNGRRLVEVDAEVIESIANADQINQRLATQILPMLTKEFPGLTFSFEGSQKQRQESFNSLLSALTISLCAIYALLAIKLHSYIQPLIIMSVIPIGSIGAVLGHIILGVPVSFLSFFGIIALSGIVINDSLILLDIINRLRDQGHTLTEAIINGAKRRFRPIIFTSLTTCVGLIPMIAEKSTQAQFLIPMAISLAAGVLFATLITLFLIPALCAICVQLNDIISKAKAKAEIDMA